MTIIALEALRNDNVDKAINIMEGKLDSEIIKYNYSQVSRESTKRLIELDIERAREYRTKYPYMSGIYSTDWDVEFVLKLKGK